MYVSQRTGPNTRVIASPSLWVLWALFVAPVYYVLKGALWLLFVLPARLLSHGGERAARQRAVQQYHQATAWRAAVPPDAYTGAMRAEDAHRGVQRPDWTQTRWAPR